MLQRRAPRGGNTAGNGARSHNAQEPAPGSLTAREATHQPGWDFSKTPVLPPEEAERPQTIHEAARHGLRGSAQTLPHREQIEKSFGRHDVGTIRAHVGGPAAEASRKIGAVAYAIGNSVAFRELPDPHTAAHEAAHVVQQRAGVHLAGGVGRQGDPYEQHADAVADAVVMGRSAQPLLDAVVDSGGGRAFQQAPPQMLQRQEEESLPEEERALDPALQGRFVGPPADGPVVQRKTYKGRGGIGIMAPANMPYFYEEGASTTEDVEASVTWEPHGKPTIHIASRDLNVETAGPGDVVSLTPVYMEDQHYGRPYPRKEK